MQQFGYQNCVCLIDILDVIRYYVCCAEGTDVDQLMLYLSNKALVSIQDALCTALDDTQMDYMMQAIPARNTHLYAFVTEGYKRSMIRSSRKLAQSLVNLRHRTRDGLVGYKELHIAFTPITKSRVSPTIDWSQL